MQSKQGAIPLALKMEEEAIQGIQGMLLQRLESQGNRFSPKAFRGSSGPAETLISAQGN